MLENNDKNNKYARFHTHSQRKREGVYLMIIER